MLKTVKRRSKAVGLELIVCSVSVLLFQLPFCHQSACLKTPSNDTDVVGYRVYSGTASRNYGSPVAVGNPTGRPSRAGDGVTYYFAATSIDREGDESDFRTRRLLWRRRAASGSAQRFDWLCDAVGRRHAGGIAGSAGGFSFSVSGSCQLSIPSSNPSDEPGQTGFPCRPTRAVHFHGHERRQMRQCFYRRFTFRLELNL